MPSVTRYGIAGTGQQRQYQQSPSATDQPTIQHSPLKGGYMEFEGAWRHDLSLPSDAVISASSFGFSAQNITDGSATWYFYDGSGAFSNSGTLCSFSNWTSSPAISTARVNAYKTGSIWVYGTLDTVGTQSGDSTSSQINVTSTYISVTYNQPPSAPASITVPTAGQVVSSGSVTLTTTGSTDPEGDTRTYYWEYMSGAVGWTAIGSTTALTYNWNTSALESRTDYQVRVRAIDTAGSNTYSAYTTSSQFTIQNVIVKVASDTLSVGAADATVATAVTVDTADPLNLSLAETQDSLLSSDVTDVISVGTDDTSATFVTVDTTDNLAVGGDDASQADRTQYVAVADDAAVAVAEGLSDVVAVITGSDDLVVAVDDGTGGSSFIVVDVADDLAVSVAEAVSSTEVTLSRTDDLSVNLDDQRDLLVDPGTRSDTLSVGTTDSVASTNVNVDTADDVTLAADDQMIDTFIGVATTDVLALAADEQYDLLVPIDVNDTFVIALDEAFPIDLVSLGRDDVTLVQLTEQADLYKMYEGGPPPDEIFDAHLAPFTRVRRRVDIYEADGVTPFMLQAPFLDGNVNCDLGRSERRQFDVQLQNIDGALNIYPDGFWYDKIFKLYRGIETPTTLYMKQLGEFMVDSASEPNFPHTLSINGRDYASKLLTSKFPAATAFEENIPIENLIHTIAVNGGITKFDLPLTGKSTQRQFFFDRQVERWKAIEEIAHAYGYDVYFTHDGYLTMEEYRDPLIDQPDYVFQTGLNVGNLASFEKRVSPSRMYNHVVVTGESSNTLPVWAEVKNEVEGHPTSVQRIGERTYFFTSAFIETQQQAMDVAIKFLKVHALEQYETSLQSLVVPWLEPGMIVDFLDPNPAPDDPTRYLLKNFTIPMRLATMPVGINRVTMVYQEPG